MPHRRVKCQQEIQRDRAVKPQQLLPHIENDRSILKFIFLLIFCSQCGWALVSPLDQVTSLHLRNTKGDVTVLPSWGYAEQPGTLCVLLSFLSCLTSVSPADGSSKRLVTLQILLVLTLCSIFSVRLNSDRSEYRSVCSL